MRCGSRSRKAACSTSKTARERHASCWSAKPRRSRLWPGQNPLQRRILLASQTPGAPPAAWRTVVGVVSDVRYRGIADVRLDVYDAPLQSGFLANRLAVRGPGDLGSLAAAVRAEVRQLDPQAVIDRVVTAGRDRRACHGALALHSLGVCRARCARLRPCLGWPVWPSRSRRGAAATRVRTARRSGRATRGVTAARAVQARSERTPGHRGRTLIALLGTRAVQGMFFQVSSLDMATYASVVGLIVTIVALASYFPARRAATVDPLELLKSE